MKAIKFLSQITGSKYYEAKKHFEYLNSIDESQLSSQERTPLIKEKIKYHTIMNNQWGRVINTIGIVSITALMFPMFFCVYKIVEILIR